MAYALLEQLRPRQWTKNLLLLAGVLFSVEFTVTSQVLRALGAVTCFCLLSSAGYIFNDLKDLNSDRFHPRKRNRPLPSGRLSLAVARVIFILLMIFGLGGAFLLGAGFGAVAVAYIALSILYTLLLKRIVLLDVMCIAILFVLRAVAGVEALHPSPQLSPWLLVCTLFLALFIAVVKRRHERMTLLENAERHRSILGEYSPELLDQMIPVVTGSTILAYALYTIVPLTEEHAPPERMIYTIPFVVYGVFRYLYLIYRKGKGGAPSEVLLTDGPLLVNVALWGVVVLLIFKLW
ncbi:MAG: decaprenyl-phosphate phosphoribosyltransferase [Candidatus Eisenbacteria sp.]|nr:decaprenyl-phosphate phosphoribosyltransferase [Candidatus Eisenbacteria bacterium]